MSSGNKTARIIGILSLATTAIAILINQVLLGPVIFGTDFLTDTAMNKTEVIVSVLLGLVGVAISISIVVLFLPIFKKYNYSAAFCYLGLSIVAFAIGLIDKVSIMAILSVSEEYLKAGSPDSEQFKILGNVFYQIRWWTHYLDILIAGLPLVVFYYILYQSKLIPRFISVWGLIGVMLMLTVVLLAIFDQGTIMILFLPLGLNQLFLSIWFIVKGFSLSYEESKLH